MASVLTLVAISDTHGQHWQLDVPPGDILVHTGDLTTTGAVEELHDFNAFLASLPHHHKLVVAGNHDFCFEDDPLRCARILTEACYLEDEAITLEGIRFYGSPWQPQFCNLAFNLPRNGAALAEKWARIPPDTDVLLTHTPPWGLRDEARYGGHVGCERLRAAVDRLRPRYHLFGHIHEAAGLLHQNGSTFVNASSCGFTYQILNPPIVLEVELLQSG
jgi:Icc-related predicted phosphoesterase